jgi:predicted ArsR family transcriptional regulator
MSLAALADSTGLHVNTLRDHLEALVATGAVSRRPARPLGRGRPAWLYLADGPDPAPRTEYAGLAIALAEGLEHGSTAPGDEAVRAGESWGRALAGEVVGATDGRTRVVRVLERMGFAPRQPPGGEIRLTRCPLLQAARAHQDVVCGVHLGVVRGVLEAAGEADTPAQLRPFAQPGACVLTIDAPAGGAQ